MELPSLSIKQQASSFIESARSQLIGIGALVGAVWLVFLLDYIPYLEWHEWLALRPRQVVGLHGVLTMPLVHASLAHILSNTIPLVITLVTLSALRPRTWPYVVGCVVVVSGLLTWVLGKNTAIIGASGLVLGLVTFLVAPGGFVLTWWGLNRMRKEAKPYPLKVHVVPLIVSAVVGFFCLDNIFFNLVPVFAPMGGANVSWRAHWCGAIAGCIVALIFARSGQPDALPGRVGSVLSKWNVAKTT